MTRKPVYRLPDYSETTDFDKMFDAWKEFAAPISKATGLQAYGFDPGVSFSDGKLSIDLPSWFIERINKALSGG